MRLTQSLCRAVQVRPHGLATIDGARRQTWEEVSRRVARLAGGLLARGLAPGDRVAVLAHNCDLFFETYFAILWAGAVIVPLNTRLRVEELRAQLADSGARMLFFGAEFAPVVAALRREPALGLACIGLDGAGEPADQGIEDLIAGHGPAAEVPREGSDLAGIFYTSGTSGRPKGVMLTHGNLAAMAVNLVMCIQVDEDCVILHCAPMFHLGDIGTFMATMVAGTHVFVRQLNEAKILELIARERITHLCTVPAVIDRLAKHPASATTDVSSLRALGYGGAPMPLGTYEVARQRFPGVDFIQGFGLTEMPSHTFLGPRHHRPGADPEKMKSAGQASYGFEVMVVGPDGRELPRRQVGEIIGRGDNVMAGYWRQPEETAKVLREGWLYTQDVGFMDEDGFVYITDRKKDMIITGAENVYSIEVENVVSRHPSVDECAVIGVPDERWGERVHAIVVLKAGAQLDFPALDAFCREQLATYKCPRSLEIRAERLPRSAAGKVLKRDLRAPHWSGRERAV
ncbi:MAG: long-chain fatty acid--CoA ligase [Gammaproteobacteria bacterium]|nr:long-chain fatty acid--CoA ligase [Gammaproteobacteria bacterium]